MPFEPRILRTDDQPGDDRAADERAFEAGALEVRCDAGSSDSSTEGWLPTELEALAEQLGEDSQHLSQKFPAPSYPAPKLAELAARMEQVAAAAESRRSSYRAWRGYAAAVSTLAAGLLIAVGTGWWMSSGTMNTEMAAVAPAEKSAATPAISHAAPDASTDSRLATREPANTATGATLAAESSAPVLEPQDFMELDSVTQSAVADLVEDGQLQQGSISL